MGRHEGTLCLQVVWLVRVRGRRKERHQKEALAAPPSRSVDELVSNNIRCRTARFRALFSGFSGYGVESSCCQRTTTSSLERALISQWLTRSRSTTKADLFYSFHGSSSSRQKNNILSSFLCGWDGPFQVGFFNVSIISSSINALPLSICFALFLSSPIRLCLIQ